MKLYGVLLGLCLCALSGAREPSLSPPSWFFPPTGAPANASLAKLITPRMSKNNASLAYHGGRLYIAFRTADHHQPRPPITGPWFTRLKLDLALRYLQVPGGLTPFLKPAAAEPRTRMYLVSAPVARTQLHRFDAPLLDSLSWRLELEAHEALGGPETDLREPLLVSTPSGLLFYFVTIEAAGLQFKPLQTWLIQQTAAAPWSKPTAVLAPQEILWEIKTNPTDHKLYASSYRGGHYEENDQDSIQVYFKRSSDGVNWEIVGERPAVYTGGASEAGFEFDAAGNVWSVLRLDDGDPERGWGGLLGFAPHDRPGDWQFPLRADPRRFDSPRLFRMGSDLYMVARQNVIAGEAANAPFDLSFVGRTPEEGARRREALLSELKLGKESNKEADLIGLVGHLLGLGKLQSRRFPISVFYEYELTYWAKHPKRTALYRIDTQRKAIEYVLTLPSAGDTSFASILPLAPEQALILNYSSPFEHADWVWATGQSNPTGLYLVAAKFGGAS